MPYPYEHAFPFKEVNPNNPEMHTNHSGMDVRTYMATHVLAGLLASGEDFSYEKAALYTVKHVDALIEKLNKGS